MKMIATLLAAVALTVCCSATPDTPNKKDMPEEDTPQYTDLSAKEFAKFIEGENVQLVDVRTAEEYAERHIKGSINIDVEADGFAEKATEALKKDAPVAVYCRSGRRSINAALLLIDAGFKDIYNLKTGINGWIAEGLPT